MSASILVISQDKEILHFLKKVLEKNRFFVDTSQDENTAIKKLSSISFDLVYLYMQDSSQPDFVNKIKAISPNCSVIVIGKTTDPSLIVQVVKNGAFDFVLYPCPSEKIQVTTRNALEHKALKNEIDYLRREQDIIYDFDDIIAESPSMKAVIETLKKFSKVDSTILITGETGTGKSFLSGAVHFNSRRRKKPFVKINCANIPELLLESELFGHEKGAFTGATKTRVGRIEQARGGTVFLDEIGELPLSLQSKLLRFLEEKKFERLGSNATITADVRIIAATNRRLEQMVKDGSFREDLYYRLNVLRVEIPPLRKRLQCIEPLAYYFLKLKSGQLKKKIKDFEPGVVEMFKLYHWPGNVRQMANVIERAVILEDSSILRKENIYLPEFEKTEKKELIQTDLEEKIKILNALKETNWVQKKAAALLGISPRMLNYKIKKYGITHHTWKKYKG